MRKIYKLVAVPFLLASTAGFAEDDAIYKQTGASIEARVKDLLGRMTLDEKVAQLGMNSTLPPLPGVPVGPRPAFGIVKKGQIDKAVAKRAIPDGIGSFALTNFAASTAAEDAAARNAIQSFALNDTRLGIPIMFMGEGLHGATIDGATSFPQAIGLGSTWNRVLMEQIFSVTAVESRAAGISLVLAPVLDLARDPRFGRVEEMYSEDPYLAGELGLKAVQGLQGEHEIIGPDNVVANAKHFVHGQPENGTNVGPNDYSERTMREVFLAPFEKAVRIGHMSGLMASYNENSGGLPSAVNPWLLEEILRKEWGFTGIVMSDGGAIPKLHDEQGFGETVGDAGVLALKAGIDLEMPNTVGFATLSDAVKAGKVSEAMIDAAAARVLTLKFRTGLFERPYADIDKVTKIMGSREHGQLARTAADQAAILLKNEGALLPLDPSKIKTLAVIGPNADKVRLGTYSSGKPAYFVTVLEGIKKRLGSKVAVSYAQGVAISGKDDPSSNLITPYTAPSPEKDAEMIQQAIETARNADTVVLALGGNETVSREAFAGILGPVPSLGDTDELELPGRQNDLVREIMKLGKPTVAVLLNGRPYSIQQLSQSVPAILEGWYLGQETGNAVAGILFGDVNPSGRLPVTIARNVGQLPVYYYRKPTARLGYVFNDNTPLYPFGFGLSYTDFSYDKPALDRAQINRDGTAKVSVKVTNTGKRAGAEVVQMYVHPKTSSVVQPIKRLAGFERVELKPGQSKTVSFAVGPEQLAIWDNKMQRTVESGKVDVMVGRNAAETTAIQLEIAP